MKYNYKVKALNDYTFIDHCKDFCNEIIGMMVVFFWLILTLPVDLAHITTVGSIYGNNKREETDDRRNRIGNRS